MAINNKDLNKLIKEKHDLSREYYQKKIPFILYIGKYKELTEKIENKTREVLACQEQKSS